MKSLYKPDPRECALLTLALIRSKEEGRDREVTRLRLAPITLARLWGRHRISDQLLAEINEWLFGWGYALFFAGTTYAIAKISAVSGWPRVSSKRLKTTLARVFEGRFDFAELEALVPSVSDDGAVEDDG